MTPVRAIGVFFVTLFLFLVYQGSMQRSIGFDKKEVIGAAERPNEVYATVDGIGVIKSLKERYFFNTAPNIFFLEVELLLAGVVLLAFPSKLETLGSPRRVFASTDLRLWAFLVLLIALLAAGLYMSLPRIKTTSPVSVTILVGLVLVAAAFVASRLRRSTSSEKVPKAVVSHWSIVVLSAIVLSNALIIEVCSRLSLIHGGPEPNVDYLGIALFTPRAEHLWSYPYAVFRVAHVLFALLALLYFNLDLNP